MNKRARAEQHESFIESLYQGNRSRSSGASVVDKGDVRTEDCLYECKTTGEPGMPARYTSLIRHMEKVADEAWAEGREPVVCLRYFLPESPLAAHDGWVDFTVRLSRDDAWRSS